MFEKGVADTTLQVKRCRRDKVTPYLKRSIWNALPETLYLQRSLIK
jgi:hypothetical protein